MNGDVPMNGNGDVTMHCNGNGDVPKLHMRANTADNTGKNVVQNVEGDQKKSLSTSSDP